MMNPSTIKSMASTVGKTLAAGTVLGVGVAITITAARNTGTSLAYRAGQSAAKHPILKELIAAVNDGAQLAEAEQQLSDLQGNEPFWATSGARRVPKRQVVLDGKLQGVSGNPGAPWAPSPNTWGFNGLTPVHPFATPASAWTQESAQSSST